MAQTNYTPISLYYSSTTTNVPTAGNLVAGELAINTADGKLFYKDSSNVVQVLATKSTGSIGGSNTQVQFNNSGSLGGSSGLTWDGSALTTSRLALGGTTLPSAGTATLFSRTSDNNVYLQTGSGNNINFLDGSQNTLASFSPTALSFNISNTNKLTLNSTTLYTASGVSVGIGTSSPSAALNIVSATNPQIIVDSGSASVESRVRWYKNGSTVGQINTDSGNFSMLAESGLDFYVNGGSLYLKLNSSGNLGLGVTPSAWYSPTNYRAVQVGASAFVGSLPYDYTQIFSNCYVNSVGTVKYINSSTATYFEMNNGDYRFNTAASGTAGATATFTTAMTLDASGRLLLGTTTNPNGIISRVKGGNGDSFEMDNDGSQFTSFYLSNNGTIKVSSYWDNTNLRYQIVPVTNGVYLSSGGVAWIAVSDERQKDIIEPITNATNKINQLRTVIGKYKTDPEGTRRSFLIAQDVQFVLPEAVDATNPNELGLSYTDTIPLLVAAIKEQQTLIDSLTTRLTALENK